MKENLNNIWLMFKAAFPFLVTLWGMGLITYVTIKIMNPEVDIDLNMLSFLGLVFTLATVPIHHYFKNRQK
jgi:hypothetical protein